MIAKVLLSTLLLSSAGLGVGALTGTLPFIATKSFPENEFGGVVVQEFAKTFEAPIATGDLDLRIDWGDVRVIGWDENAYLVRVLQAETGDGAASDYETVVDFHDNSAVSHLSLAMTVTRDGTYNVGTENGIRIGEDRPDTAIVAFVPRAAAFDTVLACSGRDSPFEGSIMLPPAPEEDPREPCLPADDTPALVGSINVMSTSSGGGLNVTFGAEGVHGKALTLFTDHGDLAAFDLDFDAIDLASEYGGLTVFSTSAKQLAATTEYGKISVKGAIANLAARTDYGDVTAQLDAAGDGAVKLMSHYGEVALLVPSDPPIGYQVEAGTDYGDIRILLADAEVDEKEGHDQGFTLDPSSWFMDDGYDKMATAETDGYASAATQVVIAAFTQYGDVVVADGILLEHIEEDDEDDGDSDLVTLDRLASL